MKRPGRVWQRPQSEHRDVVVGRVYGEHRLHEAVAELLRVAWVLGGVAQRLESGFDRHPTLLYQPVGVEDERGARLELGLELGVAAGVEYAQRRIRSGIHK